MNNNNPVNGGGNASSPLVSRYLTPVVTAFVLAITISALIAGGGVRDFRPLTIAVSPRIENGPAIADALRDLLAIETGRSVRLADRPRDARGEFDLFLMLYSDFSELLEKKPIPSVAGYMAMLDDAGQPLTDSIVIVSRPEDADYLGNVVNQVEARVGYPGGDERVLAAVGRLETAGAGHPAGPKIR